MDAPPSYAPLPARAAALLAQLDVPPRLMAHLTLVHAVALQAVEGLLRRWPSLKLDREAVAFGAAIHDIGKVLHREELRGGGNQHEQAGRALLLSLGVEPELARFAVTHGARQAETQLEDLLVALADTLWKGQRDERLEQRIAERITQELGADGWETFIALDDLAEALASAADERLAWHAQFPTG